MGKRIILFNQTHPDEPFEAEVEQSTLTEMTLLIPNTQVRFKLSREEGQALFSGSLEGHQLFFDPSQPPFAALFDYTETNDRRA